MPTIKEVKEELKKKGLKTSGNKAQLIDRLNGNQWTSSYTPPGNFLTGTGTPYDNIWVASVQGNYSMVQRHLQISKTKPGYNIDQLSPFGRTALEQASLAGHIHTVRYLINEGSMDLNGTAYLSTNTICRKMLTKMGFKGHSFMCLPQVKLLVAKRNLVLSQICGELDYDTLLMIIGYTQKCFSNGPLYHSVLKRSVLQIHD